MTAHTMSQTLTSVRQAIRKYAWWLIFSLVLGVAALTAYRSVSLPTTSTPVVTSSQRTTSVDPVQQSVFDYLRAHSTVQPIQAPRVPLDPAQQSVMDYLHAHDRVDPSSASWDQATQAVLDYLRAHSR